MWPRVRHWLSGVLNARGRATPSAARPRPAPSDPRLDRMRKRWKKSQVHSRVYQMAIIMVNVGACLGAVCSGTRCTVIRFGISVIGAGEGGGARNYRLQHVLMRPPTPIRFIETLSRLRCEFRLATEMQFAA